MHAHTCMWPHTHAHRLGRKYPADNTYTGNMHTHLGTHTGSTHTHTHTHTHTGSTNTYTCTHTLATHTEHTSRCIFRQTSLITLIALYPLSENSEERIVFFSLFYTSINATIVTNPLHIHLKSIHITSMNIGTKMQDCNKDGGGGGGGRMTKEKAGKEKKTQRQTLHVNPVEYFRYTNARNYLKSILFSC